MFIFPLTSYKYKELTQIYNYWILWSSKPKHEGAGWLNSYLSP
jgi:hypothetical protein